MSVFSDVSSHHTLSGPNNDIITKTSGTSWTSSYGTDIIKSSNNDIIQYQIKINKMNSRIGVGIVSNLHHHDTNKALEATHAYWLNVDNGYVSVEHGQKGYNGHKCATGDILT
eukprot:13112_1